MCNAGNLGHFLEHDTLGMRSDTVFRTTGSIFAVYLFGVSEMMCHRLESKKIMKSLHFVVCRQLHDRRE